MAKRNSLTRFLNELEKEELIEEIEKLCAKFPVVKKYFDIELSGDAAAYVRKAKKEMDAQLFGSNGSARNHPKASKLNNIIRDFEKISIYKEDVIELLVYRVEQTMKYAKEMGDVAQPLFDSTERTILRALQLIKDEGLEEKYAERTEEFSNPNWRIGKPKDWKPGGLYWSW